MGNQLSSAHHLAVGSFAVNFGTQIYGMVTSPNMKDIADANHFAFSPNPWFIGAFFSGQMLAQLYWIRQLYKTSPLGYQPLRGVGAGEVAKEQAEDEAAAAAVQYAPIYAIGNLCIAGWLIFWLREGFNMSQILVTANTALQLFAVSRLPPLTASSPPLLWATHLVAKTTAGIGIMDFVDNGGVALRTVAPPSVTAQAFTYLAFPALAAASGPIFGSTLVYDLIAMYVGQRSVVGAGSWSAGLGWTALATGSIVAVKSLMSVRK
ncbi:hypothetical protein PHLGIDRAFT_94545 [Phlebiopsis gigantea 11061_1 CR5-6]|uniref:Uncharacterized protein n=1 Tax=Phlebiopsis gigantea (strain 11061_1 CR5-6) TaxID=745531 RepID=A0A0C3S5M3_PHLG1|nr:hypothetical protein PHLGIDRAFT_94545 [Phlebiopsis gigantea 11061_1 CR5-6]